MMNKTEALNELEQQLEGCQRCSLYKNRTNIVFGAGSANANLMMVSEAPGYWEDQKGEPFVGAAGKILNELLESIGTNREEVYIANLLKCRPPENRDPKAEEIQACTPFLEKQIKIIEPEVICPLGRFAMEFLMEKYGMKEKIQGISKIHGQVMEISNLFQHIRIVPLYHPAVATYNPNMKEVLKKDFEVLKKYTQ